jgi:hypothetical protein
MLRKSMKFILTYGDNVNFYLDYFHDVIFQKNMLLIVVWIMKQIDSGHINLMILKCYQEQSMKKIVF